MRTAGIYVRVSSSSQKVDSQLPDLNRWVAAQDVEVLWYKDKATGTNMDRPDWQRLESDYRSGKVDTIVCWRLDRLGRTARGLTALFEDLLERGINLISLRDGVDLNTPSGRLMANVLASVAQFETRIRSERQRAGIEAARMNGTRLGRRPGKHTRISVTREQHDHVRKLKEQGTPTAVIARLVKLNRSTVYDLLRKEPDSNQYPD